MRHGKVAFGLCLVLLVMAGWARERADSSPGDGPDFSRAARPRGWFYLNGLGHQYLQGTDYTVVAAAMPVLNGRFFGVKLRVVNRGGQSVNVLPDEMMLEDSVSGKQLSLYSAAEVLDKLGKPSGMQRLAGIVGGDMPGQSSYGGAPTVSDLLREMMREASAESPWGGADGTPQLTTRGATRVTAATSAACDLGCELRNREIGDGNGPQLARRLVKADVLEQSEFLANTIPPTGDAVGVLYFAMPKLTDKAPVSHTGRKSYQVTLTVPIGSEKFQFVFPPE